MMKSLLMIVFLIITFNGISSDRTDYYKVLECNDEKKISAYIDKLESEPQTNLTRAYIAALECKMADLVLNPADKLDYFKKGATTLDDLIDEYPNIVEYRYLRLTIQEHAPSLMRYDENLEEDKEIILSKFDQLSEEMKAIIIDYAKKSEILDVEELD